MSCRSFDSTSANASTPAWHLGDNSLAEEQISQCEIAASSQPSISQLHWRASRMKHKFHVFPVLRFCCQNMRRELPDGKRAALHTELAQQRGIEIEHRAATMKFL